MNLRDKLFDSAVLLAIGTGTLYLLGMFHLSGSALGHGIPVALLTFDPADVLSDGATALLTLPISVFYYRNMMTIAGLCIVISLIVYRLDLINQSYLLFLLGGVILLALCMLVLFGGVSTAEERNQRNTACVSNKTCEKHSRIATITMLDPLYGAPHVGVLLDIKSSFLVLQEKDLVIFLLKERVASVVIKQL